MIEAKILVNKNDDSIEIEFLEFEEHEFLTPQEIISRRLSRRIDVAYYDILKINTKEEN